MTLDFFNFRGDKLSLSENDFFYLINVDSQTAATTNISSITIGGIDGDTVNNIQAQPRPIVLDLRIKNAVNVEEAKRKILSIVKLKQECSLIWTQNDREVIISGIVETVDMPRWENGVTMQIFIHCPQPFWEDIDAIIQEISEAIPLHYFTENDNMLSFPELGIPLGEYDFTRTRSIYNSGDVAVGMEIEVRAYDVVTNPIIYDTDGNFFGIGYGDGAKKVVMQSGDVISINTTKGSKSVSLNGVSLLGKIKPLSTWLQLQAGDNLFSINSDDDNIHNMTFTLNYKRWYI